MYVYVREARDVQVGAGCCAVLLLDPLAFALFGSKPVLLFLFDCVSRRQIMNAVCNTLVRSLFLPLRGTG